MIDQFRWVAWDKFLFELIDLGLVQFGSKTLWPGAGIRQIRRRRRPSCWAGRCRGWGCLSTPLVCCTQCCFLQQREILVRNQFIPKWIEGCLVRGYARKVFNSPSPSHQGGTNSRVNPAFAQDIIQRPGCHDARSGWTHQFVKELIRHHEWTHMIWETV